MKSSTPQLTIGLLVYNGEKLLWRVLRSILAQTFTDFELIIVDNASTDKTETIARTFASKDARIIYKRNQLNMGPSYSWFKSMLTAGDNAKYFMLVHCDLVLAPTYLEECIAKLEEDEDAVLAYSYCQWIDEYGANLEISKDDSSFAHDDAKQRYLNILSKLGWCTAFHGVMRYQSLTKEFFNIGFETAAGDNELLALLALQGKLVQVEKPLFLRVKDSYQKAGGESIAERYERLYADRGVFHFGPKKYLPFINFIRQHCFFLLYSGLEPEDANNLIQQTIAILLARYEQQINFEIRHLIKILLQGTYKQGWGKEEQQSTIANTPLGKYPYLDFTCLLYVQQSLEYVCAFKPEFSQLKLARAVVFIQLGRNAEALFTLEQELKQNSENKMALDLLKLLQNNIKGS